MKTLALLSIYLALPLAAQSVDAKPDKPPAPQQTALTPDEHDQLALVFMQAQAARINLLQLLAQKQAGNDDLVESDKAAQAYSTALTALAKKHGADNCNWNFAGKQWACPPVADSAKK